jgi:hypothetical protein
MEFGEQSISGGPDPLPRDARPFEKEGLNSSTVPADDDTRKGTLVKRFRSHAIIFGVIAVAVIVMVLSHSVRVRLEWGTGGFVVGVISGVLLAADVRHHRKR